MTARACWFNDRKQSKITETRTNYTKFVMQDAEAPRYEDDLYSWSLDQADRLRKLQKRTGNDSQGVDFENIIEEVEDLSAQVRRIVIGHLDQIITHMGAIAYTSPDKAEPYVNHWLGEIDVFRSNIVKELNGSPGIKGQLDEICDDLWEQNNVAIVQKVNELGELGHTGRMRLRNRIDQETTPTADELLGFNWRLHEQRSGKTLTRYFDEDPDAPRYPAFVRDALNRIEELDRSAGRRRD